MRIVVLITLAAAAVQAQTPAPPLIPVPREVRVLNAPLTLRQPVVIVSGAEADDKSAAQIFAEELAERRISARIGDSTAGA
ncbi:MAG TPA: hypothetical protein VE967_14785, partial [Gemmatimonadaceae bacterium]|nr:hypothetical protein [Gemmatimonadaceae bacterium]